MAYFQSLGLVALFNDISNSLARKGVMASPPNFRISAGTPSSTTDLSLPILANLLIILVLITKVSPELANCIFGMLTIAVKDGCIIGI